jgi:tRNA pseudouridine(55) synthase
MTRVSIPINGWINLNKPVGMSSAQAVGKVKWLLRPQKIGHAGTLDPLASGILPLALGEATKCVNLLMDAKKIYEFTVTFGERRSTDDAEGEVVATSDVIPTEDQIRHVLPRFMGEITQIPPIYSAIKVDGERAYALARAGEVVEMKSRVVNIYELEFLGFEVDAGEAFPPCGGRLDGGASVKRPYISLAQEEKIQDRAQGLRSNATDVEKQLWRFLRAEQLGGFKFRRQHPVDHYIVDFVCLKKRLIVELDGGQHADAIAQDKKRSAYFESQGFKVIRFWNHEVMENIDGVLQVILVELGASFHTPLPNPPRKGEGTTEPIAPVDATGEASPPAGEVGGGAINLASALSNAPHPPPPTPQFRSARFRARVGKGTYIRSLGRDIAQALGSEGYISRLHRAAVGPFTESNAISLDFLENLQHNPAILPLTAVLDDIPVLALTADEHQRLRHGQSVMLKSPIAPAPLIAALFNGQLVALTRSDDGRMLVSVRILN